MDSSTAKMAALEGLPVILQRPGTEPVCYSKISALRFVPKKGRLILSLELVDMVQGVTVARADHVRLKEDKDNDDT